MATQQEHIGSVYRLEQIDTIENVDRLDGDWIVVQLNLLNKAVVELKVSQPCIGAEKEAEHRFETYHC